MSFLHHFLMFFRIFIHPCLKSNGFFLGKLTGEESKQHGIRNLSLCHFLFASIYKSHNSTTFPLNCIHFLQINIFNILWKIFTNVIYCISMCYINIG